MVEKNVFLHIPNFVISISLEDTVQMTPVVMPEESVSVHASVDSLKPAYTVKIGQ